MYIQVFLPSRKQLTDAGWRRYDHVPALFADGTHYLAEPNRYLRELATGDWRINRPERINGRIRRPTPQTLKNNAQNLANFLRWCDEYHDDNGILKALDWRDLEYSTDIVDGYQEDMRHGRWGLHALKPGTVNARGDEATRFLEWAAWRGLRPPFLVEKEVKTIPIKSGTHSHGHRPKTVVVRVGRQRASPDELLLPTREATTVWLDDVKQNSGTTKGLMSELILRSGIRLAECMKWRLDTLPEERAKWRVVRNGSFVEVLIRAGNKGGSKQPDETGELTLHPTGRKIHLPIDLAIKLSQYAETTRPSAWGKYVRDKRVTATERNRRARQPLPLELFLSDSTGLPFSGQTLRNAWKTSSSPIDGWSPHLGRHYYACYFLLSRIEEQAELLQNLDQKTAMLVVSSPAFLENYWQALQQQLGHIDKKTTERYTVWLRQVVQESVLVRMQKRQGPDSETAGKA